MSAGCISETPAAWQLTKQEHIVNLAKTISLFVTCQPGAYINEAAMQLIETTQLSTYLAHMNMASSSPSLIKVHRMPHEAHIHHNGEDWAGISNQRERKRL